MNTTVDSNFSSMPADDPSKGRLTRDLQGVVSASGELLKDAAHATAEGFADIGLQAKKKLGVVKTKLEEERIRLLQETRSAAEVTQTYIQENPWRSVGVSAMIGLAVGILIRRD